MNKKTLLTIALVIILLLLGVMLVYWFWSNQKDLIDGDKKVDVVTTDKTDEISGILDFGDDKEIEEIEIVVPKDTKLLSATRYFVERWGSYSNQSGYQNIKDLKSYMTDDFYDEAISKTKQINYNEIDDITYEGFEAKVMSISWEDQGDEEATAVVTTNRRHILEDSVETYPQDIRVNLIKQGNAWIVAKAVWMDK